MDTICPHDKSMLAVSLTRDPRIPRTVAGAFPVEEGDEMMLVTDRGQAIRCPVRKVSMHGRIAGGVWTLRKAAEGHIVSVGHIVETETDATALEDDPRGTEPEILGYRSGDGSRARARSRFLIPTC